jgi:hypothetical protein
MLQKTGVRRRKQVLTDHIYIKDVVIGASGHEGT